MVARLVVLTLFMIVLSLLLPAGSIAFYLFMALAYVVTIPYALWLRNLRQSGGYVGLQFVVDLVLVTGLVYFSGGLNSDLCLLYPLVILSAGIVTGPARAMQVAILSSLAYGTLVALCSQGVLVGYAGTAIPADWLEIGKPMAWRILVFLCFGAGSAYLARRCYYAERGVAQLREMSEIVFRKVGAGLLLLDDRQTIVKANDFAIRLLGRSPGELEGLTLSEIVDTKRAPPVVTESDTPIVYYLNRGDGTSFPITSEISPISLPSSLLRPRGGNQKVEAGIMVFSDVTHILEMEDRMRRSNRIQAAATAATEIAHEIRNPLAVVSGAVQVLQRLEQRAAKGDALSARMLRKERKEIFSQIVSQSLRLDETIERFINCAESTPDAVAELLQIQEAGLNEPSFLSNRCATKYA